MRERKQDVMREAELDRLLECGLADLPPGDVLEGVTPWKRAMNRVLLGMALTGITLNALCLNYLLPAVGMALLLLGFRALRRENRWFGACWGVTVARTAYGYGLLVLNATILRGAFYASPAAAALAAADLALLLAECFCLRGGLRAVQQKAGLPPHAGGAAALMVWYGILGILAVTGYSGLLLGAAVLVMYVLILRSLWKLSKELDEAGYGVRPAPVRISDRAVAAALAALLALGCACGYLLGGRYPMEWAPVDAGEHSGVEESKARLLALGVPDYVLNDLTAEDLAACDGAIQVVVDVDDYPVNSGRVEPYWPGSSAARTVYDVKELRITRRGRGAARGAVDAHSAFPLDNAPRLPRHRVHPALAGLSGRYGGLALRRHAHRPGAVRRGRTDLRRPLLLLGRANLCLRQPVLGAADQRRPVRGLLSAPGRSELPGLLGLSHRAGAGRLHCGRLVQLHPPAELDAVSRDDRDGEPNDQWLELGRGVL